MGNCLKKIKKPKSHNIKINSRNLDPDIGSKGIESVDYISTNQNKASEISVLRSPLDIDITFISDEILSSFKMNFVSKMATLSCKIGNRCIL